MREVKFRGKANGQWWHVTANDEYDNGEWEQFWAIVDRKTVGQWTGSDDRHGNNIYEGDILYLDYTHWAAKRVVVEYNECMISPLADDCFGEPWCDAFAGQYEVIGNIYENSDLLGKRK